MKFAILLPVYNHLAYTKLTLEILTPLLGEIENEVFDILLIDDGSTDGTSDWVRLNYPDVIILEGDGDLWWSGAVNMGASYALDQLKVDYLILWNNDIIVHKKYFNELVAICNGLNEPVVLGSKILVEGQPDMVWSAGGFFNPRSGKINMYGYFQNDSDEFCQVREVDWFTGMGTIIPKEVIEKIGFWDNVNFPQYHGDTDFTYRAKLEGFPLRIYPSLILYNHVENSGIEHHGNFKSLLKLITDIRSKSNLRKNLIFYKKYVRSPFAYLPLTWFYLKIFGGFFKWKLLRMVGLRKKNTV